MVKTFKLTNGITVVTYNIPQVKSIHMSIAIKGGSMVEKKGLNGVAHFMEHMLVQGTPSFPTVEKLSTHVESLAGSYNAYTSQLLVSFVITLPFIHVEEAIKIGSEVIFSPLFPQEALERERKAVLSEILQRKDSLGYKLGKEFKEVRFTPDSLLQLEIGGQLDAVKKITREDLQAYWQTYFIPSNTYIYIGGNFEEKQLLQLLETYFGHHQSIEKFSGYPQITTEDFISEKVVLKEHADLGTNYLTLSFPGLSLQDHWKLTAQQDIALTILGQLRTSRLFKLLRYEKGLVYNVSSQRAQLPTTGYIDVGSEVSSENLDEVLELIIDTVSTYIKNGPTKEELDFVKSYFTSAWLMAFDNPASVADWLEEEILWEEKVRMPEEYIAMIKEVTVEDITSIMQTKWNMEKLQLLIQGPIKQTQELQEKYLQLLKKLL